MNKRHQRKQNRKATDIILPPEETDIKVWDNKMISQYRQRDKQRKKAKIPQWKYKNPFAVKRLTGTGRTETKGPYMDLCEKANSIVRNVSFPYHDIIFTNQNGHGIELAEWELAKALANNPHKLYQYQERGVLGLFLRSILEKAPEHHYQKQLLPYNSTVRNFLRISPEDNTDLQNNSEMEIINKQIDTLLRMYIANSIDGILMDCAGEYTFTESGYEYYNNHANNLLTTYWYTCYADSNFERKDILSNLPQADELSDDFYTLYHFLIHNIQVSSGDVNAVLNYYLNEARLHSMQNIQKSCMEYLKSFISFFENGEPLICQPFINEHYISELKERKDLTQSVKRFFDDKEFALVAALGGTEGVKRMIATEIWDMYFNYEKGFTTNEPAVCRFYSMDESECFNCEYRDQFSGMDGSFICPHNFFKPALERYLSSSELVSHREALRKKLRRSTKTNIQL